MIAAVALLVLGPKRLPSAARALGRAASELRRATTDLRQSLELDPELKELPRALDEINRPLLSPGPYSRKRPSHDGPVEGQGPPSSNRNRNPDGPVEGQEPPSSNRNGSPDGPPEGQRPPPANRNGSPDGTGVVETIQTKGARRPGTTEPPLVEASRDQQLTLTEVKKEGSAREQRRSDGESDG